MDHTHLPPIIGLYSPVPQSGKTMLAEFLENNHALHRMSFAEPIKRMADVLLSEYLGYAPDYLALTRGSFKDEPLEEWGYSRRDIEVALGNGIRNHLDQDFWCDVLMRRAEDAERPVIVDDVRFPNEYAAVLGMGGQMWRIERMDTDWGLVETTSESNLEDFLFDLYFENNDSPKDLFAEVEEYLIDLSVSPMYNDS